MEYRVVWGDLGDLEDLGDLGVLEVLGDLGDLKVLGDLGVREVLGDAKVTADLGRHFGAGLTAREVDYMLNNEWALSADDVLWRRSKSGLRMNENEQRVLAEFIVGQSRDAA